jgi:superfamily II DNA or RNA helicase
MCAFKTGISAAVVHGGTELAVRQQIFADFKSGKLNAITNCNVLTEVSTRVYACTFTTANLPLY